MSNSGAPRIQRRLAAILAADVVGFSRLMERDEAGTLARIKSLRTEVIEPLVAEHGGRLFKTMGDGFLVEFPSPVEAVEAAMGILSTKASQAGADALRLRIGINLGDLVVEPDGDVFGDGVNVAARLERIANPGTVLVSGKVYEEVKGKLPFMFEDRGEQCVKNIERPVRAYQVVAENMATQDATATSPPPSGRSSIAVLPFTNLTGNPEQEYFVDGVVEDIIIALSRFRWFFVIARSSSFTYKGKSVDIRQVGRELGVRYILTGSFRKGGSRVRVTGELIEVSTGRNVWADHFDGELSDIFELQDKVTASVVAAVEPNLLSVEIDRAAKPTNSLSAYDLYLRALPEMSAYTKDGFLRAEALLERALQLDDRYSDAWAALSDCIARRVIAGWLEDWDEGAERACHAASRAVAADPENSRALSVSAWTLGIFRNNDEAFELATRALQLHPNSAYAQTAVAWVLIFRGAPDRALEHLEVARKINPLDPREYLTLNAMALAHLVARRFAEVLRLTERAIEQHPMFPPAYRFRAAALGHLGRTDEAAALIQQLLKIQPIATLSRTARLAWNPAAKAILIDGLRKAGLPE